MPGVEVWVPLAAAFGSASLTALALFGVEFWRERLRDNKQLDRERARAYSNLLAVTGVIANTAGSLRLTVKVRSGWAETAWLLLRLKKPIEPLDLDAHLRQDLVPLYAAWADVLTFGSRRAVDVANTLVDQSGRVVAEAVAYRQGFLGEARRAVIGVRWSEDDEAAYRTSLATLAERRAELADLARAELGIEAAETLPLARTDTRRS